jgi:hypothetical protein
MRGVKATLLCNCPRIVTCSLLSIGNLCAYGIKGATSAENLRDSPSPGGKEPSDFCPHQTHPHIILFSSHKKNHFNILVLYTVKPVVHITLTSIPCVIKSNAPTAKRYDEGLLCRCAAVGVSVFGRIMVRRRLGASTGPTRR